MYTAPAWGFKTCTALLVLGLLYLALVEGRSRYRQ